MSLEVRRMKEGEAPEHFVVGHAPNGGNPEKTETINWDSNEMVVAANEVFAAAEAAELFKSYGRTGWVPSTYVIRPKTPRMTSIEQLYNDIGGEALAMAGDDLGGKLLVYAEVAKGKVFVCDLLYKNRKGDVNVVVAADPLMEIVYDFWDLWPAEHGNQEWRAMSYVVDGGKFTIEVTYPDDVNAEEAIGDRRQRAIEKYFGKAKRRWFS